MDILDKLLNLAQISGSVNVKCQFQGNWAISHPTHRGQAMVHIITQGKGYLDWLGADEPIGVQAGDVICFPKGLAHRLSGEPIFAKMPEEPTACVREGAFWIKQSTGESGAVFSMFCANFAYDPNAVLMASLPEMVQVQFSPPQYQGMVSLLQAEVDLNALGATQVVNSLALVLIALIIREYLAQSPDLLSGVLNGWQNTPLRHLLNRLLESPEADWSVDNMAAFAHLSRSTFIRLFKQSLGTSPHAFLHHIRLQKAAMLLKQRSDSVLSIALSCGFQSETHFGKAFKKQYAMTPSQYRKAVSDSQHAEFPVE